MSSGLEAWASGDPLAAVEAFRAAFSLTDQRIGSRNARSDALDGRLGADEPTTLAARAATTAAARPASRRPGHVGGADEARLRAELGGHDDRLVAEPATGQAPG